MGAIELYDVVVEAFSPGADCVGGLMNVFGVDAATAGAIVQRVPVVVKRSVSRDAARPFEESLRAIGARVTLRPCVTASVGGRRPSGAIETSLMHGGGWQSDAPAHSEPRTSLPSPAAFVPQAMSLPLVPTFEFVEQAAVASPPPRPSTPQAIDPRARTTRFAADLELPWVGPAPEPSRGNH